jgi:hypothetical protein
MPSKPKERDGAQSQHYVPKFILRNFLSDEKKEQVSVFRKSTGKGFVTSIRNIMAERRFHEFAISPDYLASFEGAICQIEETLLPTYRKVVEQRRLDRSDEERANLATFMAFQFVRTRQQREQFVRMEEQIKAHLAKLGGTIEQLEGYEPLTEDRLTEQHIRLIRSAVPEFAQNIGAKDLLLLSAPEGRSFYLADSPVCLHNSEPAHPLFGNLGLAVRGIEIYLPLTANLMLAAWCPSLLDKIHNEHHRQSAEHQGELLSMLMRNEISPAQMRIQLSALAALRKPVDNLLSAFASGEPIILDESNMDFCNSLQMNYARDYVICKQGDFALARRFVSEFSGNVGRGLTAM